MTFEERLEEGVSHGGRGIPGANRLSRGCETGREVEVVKGKGIGGIAESSEGGWEQWHCSRGGLCAL